METSGTEGQQVPFAHASEPCGAPLARTREPRGEAFAPTAEPALIRGAGPRVRISLLGSNRFNPRLGPKTPKRQASPCAALSPLGVPRPALDVSTWKAPEDGRRRRQPGQDGRDPSRAPTDWREFPEACRSTSLPMVGRAAPRALALSAVTRPAIGALIGPRGRARFGKLASRRPRSTRPTAARTLVRLGPATAPRRHSEGRRSAGPRGATREREPGLSPTFAHLDAAAVPR